MIHYSLHPIGLVARLVALVLLTTLTGPSCAKTIALVVGNGAYGAPLSKIANSAQDAIAIAERLKFLGVELWKGRAQVDLDETTMRAAFSDFSKSVEALGAEDAAIVFYKGHGERSLQGSLLFSTDYGSPGVEGIEWESSLLAKLKTHRHRATVVVIDACRDTSQTGMAEPAIIPTNTVVFFSAQPGSLADPTTPFGPMIADHIGDPGERIGDVFARIQSDLERTGQTPAIYGSVRDFSLKAATTMEVTSISPDDGVTVTINGATILSASNSDPRKSVTVPLKTGTNRGEILVYNKKSRRNGHFWESLEGWHYTIVLADSSGHQLAKLESSEDAVPEDSNRYDGTFLAGTFLITVDRKSGAAVISEADPRAWRKK